MSGKIGFILIVIVVMGVILYVYQSGTVGRGTDFLESIFKLPTSSVATAQPTRTYIGPPPVPSAAPVGAAPAVGSYGGVPAGFTAAELSPHFREIHFGGLTANFGPGQYGQISLYASFYRPSTTIDITGWQIKTIRGLTYVPQAVNVYEPMGLAPLEDIRMGQGDYLNIYFVPIFSTAPVNLRLNKCTGYLAATTLQFNPPLPQNCPYLDRADIQTLTGACQTFILSIGSCTQPDLNSFSFPRNDYTCLRYITDHFNYRSCFDEHVTDPDFLSHEIRVSMGSSPFDQLHDRVLLLDQKGLLVDFYEY